MYELCLFDGVALCGRGALCVGIILCGLKDIYIRIYIMLCGLKGIVQSLCERKSLFVRLSK